MPRVYPARSAWGWLTRRQANTWKSSTPGARQFEPRSSPNGPIRRARQSSDEPALKGRDEIWHASQQLLEIEDGDLGIRSHLEQRGRTREFHPFGKALLFDIPDRSRPYPAAEKPHPVFVREIEDFVQRLAVCAGA